MPIIICLLKSMWNGTTYTVYHMIYHMMYRSDRILKMSIKIIGNSRKAMKIIIVVSVTIR